MDTDFLSDAEIEAELERISTTYLEVNADGLVVNAISWDGESPYFPEEGITLYPFDPNVNHWIGWTLNVDGSWSAPIEFNDVGG